jgi:catechol 2,3-dioxygenase-like lactoylglutathione lyase family enzyme
MPERKMAKPFMMHTCLNEEFEVAQAFDRILIAVADINDAREQYGLLLGVNAEERSSADAVPEVWIGLRNTVLAFHQADVETAQITGLVLRDSNSQARSVENTLGLRVEVCDGSETEEFRSNSPGAQRADVAVDHLVLRTQDAQACIDLFAEELGIRLALDKTVPQWGGRMLFFRAGKMTLEVIESDKDESEGNYFWGIAYQHEDLDKFCAELQSRDVAYSEVRDGRKPGTRVSTAKSHCLDLPTLLIEPVKESTE